MSVTALEQDDAIKLITEPVQGRLIFTNDAVEKVCFLTASQPYLTQCLCTRIFDLAARKNNTSITVDVVNSAAILLIENNDPDENEIIIPVSLTVTSASDIELDADSLNFGEVFAGNQSPCCFFRVFLQCYRVFYSGSGHDLALF